MNRVIVSGHRGCEDEKFIQDELMRILRDVIPELEIVVGDCPTGVDRFARQWAEDIGVGYRVFDADWDLWDKAAGPIRNGEMALYLYQARGKGDKVSCICFIHPKSKGTKDMAQKASRYKIDVTKILIK